MTFYSTDLPLRDLEAHYDGVIPFPLREQALSITYARWQSRIAGVAERNFHGLILNSLILLAAWRQQDHPQRHKQLQRHSTLVALYRERACAAHDLACNLAL